MDYVPTYRSTLSRHPPSCASTIHRQRNEDERGPTNETISSLQVVRGDAWELESAQDREIGRAQKTEAAAARQSNADQGTSHPQAGEGREPLNGRMVPVDPPGIHRTYTRSSIRASLEYIDEWLSEPPDSELLEPSGMYER